MPELLFFRQERHDGGVRMGLEFDDETIWSSLIEGPAELQDDPLGSALIWYVDLIIRGEQLPSTTEELRAWLLSQTGMIQKGIHRFAEEISAGVDDSYPMRWNDFPDASPGLQIVAVCSAVRSVTGKRLELLLKDFADHFGDYLTHIPWNAPNFALR